MTQLHHFEITTSSLERRVAQFQAQFGFTIFAHKDEKEGAAVAMHCHSIVVVIKECSGWSPVPHGDWISDVAMKVSDTNHFREQAIRAGANFAGSEGSSCGRDKEEATFTICSPFSSVCHTMIARCNGGCTQESSSSDGLKSPSHSGLEMETCFTCLPGFVKCPQTRGRPCGVCSDRFPRQLHRLPQTSHVDHVTFACKTGTSEALVDWYRRCLGFCRFFPGSGDNGQGYITYGSNGMRMLATQYWQCWESGVRAPVTSKQTGRQVPVQLVFAEPIPGSGPNQVQVFLDENGCAGVQHIAFHCDNIVSSVSCLRQNGVRFIRPPPEYYSMMEKVTEIGQVGEELELLRANGILIDTEVEEDEEENVEESEGTKCTRYLMQTFSHPLFERETFFIELIRRCGAKGFGSGNIAALWKALDIHFKQNMAH